MNTANELLYKVKWENLFFNSNKIYPEHQIDKEDMRFWQLSRESDLRSLKSSIIDKINDIKTDPQKQILIDDLTYLECKE